MVLKAQWHKQTTAKTKGLQKLNDHLDYLIYVISTQRSTFCHTVTTSSIHMWENTPNENSNNEHTNTHKKQ